MSFLIQQSTSRYDISLRDIIQNSNPLVKLDLKFASADTSSFKVAHENS